jgi:ABC-type polysaccharide/polyol phosphate export permease
MEAYNTEPHCKKLFPEAVIIAPGLFWLMLNFLLSAVMCYLLFSQCRRDEEDEEYVVVRKIVHLPNTGFASFFLCLVFMFTILWSSELMNALFAFDPRCSGPLSWILFFTGATMQPLFWGTAVFWANMLLKEHREPKEDSNP